MHSFVLTKLPRIGKTVLTPRSPSKSVLGPKVRRKPARQSRHIRSRPRTTGARHSDLGKAD